MADELNTLIVQRSGPNLVTGELAIVTQTPVRALQSAMLGRCGQSRDKPFCDSAAARVALRRNRRTDDPAQAERSQPMRRAARDSRFGRTNGELEPDIP